jgi:glycosyl hydrolase family 113
MKKHLSDWRIFLLAVAVVTLIGITAVMRTLANSQSGFEYNGIVHVSWWFDEYTYPDATESRSDLVATGANWAAVLVTQYQDTANSIVIAPVAEKTPTDAALITAIQDLHGKGMKVMLKPHVDPWNGQWRGDINPTDINAWFASYTQFIVHYAQLAEEHGVEAYCMGTELRTISGDANRDRWVAVISAIRSVYSGVLTYAANATFPADEFTSVSFWDQLDIIGLDGYFTLTDQANPTLAQLIAAWRSNRFGEDAVAAVQNFAESRQKPVIFTEIGYKSTDRTNIEPWNFGLAGALDTAEQRDCYEAAFTVWSQQSSWMKGFFWWAWPVPAPAENDTDYNPRGKPAEAVLRTWQEPPVEDPDFALSINPATISLNRGTSRTSVITITRSGGFTGSVALSASGLPAGVTATFNPTPATDMSSTIALAAANAAAAGTVTVTITGVGGNITRSTTLILTVDAPPAPDVTVTTAVNANSPWYNEEVIRLSNTANITSLSLNITVQRTAGIGLNGMYNTVGGLIQQSNSSSPTAIKYQFTLAPGQALWPGTNWTFAAQTNGTGMLHPVASDTYSVTYTTGGATFTQSGHF